MNHATKRSTLATPTFPLAAALLTALLLIAVLSAAAEELSVAGAAEVARLRIVNDSGGEIAVSVDGGETWHRLGQVLRYTTRVNRNGYTASKWVPPGLVAATAVNAIHISVGLNEEDDRGIIFSLLPRQFLVAPKDYRSFLSPDSSIYTDLPAGEGIFGGGEAPFVGNPVCREQEDGTLVLLERGYVPAQGDRLIVIVLQPRPYPVAVEFENTEGGAITMRFSDGSQKLLGWVVHPVGGVGRFAGSVYAAVGRVRANHAGVVDISTSPERFLGAFQIIPVGHALSPEMELAWTRTQWMIVGPLEEPSPLWESLMPLFCQYLRPDYLPGDLAGEDWEARLLARFLVEADFGNGWQPMPALRLSPDPSAPLPDWADAALARVTRLRVLFPLGHAATWPGQRFGPPGADGSI